MARLRDLECTCAEFFHRHMDFPRLLTALAFGFRAVGSVRMPPQYFFIPRRGSL
jgi:hypothetical protein